VPCQGAIFLTSLLLLFVLWPENQFADFLTKPLCIVYSLHFIWCFLSWRVVTGRWFDSYTILLLSLGLFNGGHFLLETFDLNRAGIMCELFSTTMINRTILLVNSAVVAYHFGGIIHILINSRNSNNPHRLPLPRDASLYSIQRAKTIGLIFLLASLPATWHTMKSSADLVLSSGYNSLYQQELRVGADNWMTVLSTFSIPGLLITFAMFHESKRLIKACWIFAMIYAALNMFMGMRSAAIMIAVPMVLLHHGIVKRIRSVFLITGCVGLLLLLPLVAKFRNATTDDQYSVLEHPLTDNLFVAAINEMGGSANTIAYTMELVPEYRSHDYGMGYVYALLTAVPNLFWERHLSAQWGSYSNWLVWTVEPNIACNGGGLGFSVIAEAYANFSILGPPLVMIILGFVIASLASRARYPISPFLAAMEAIFISSVVILPRAETAMIIRPLIWFCLIPWLLVARSWEGHNTQDWLVISRQAKVAPDPSSFSDGEHLFP
jgi:oligosaccharide repeat unit polymerase